MSNIITVAFDGATSVTSTDTVYQYDYGQRVYFPDLELDEYFEVHFSNTRVGNAVTVIGHNNYADVPDSCLSTGLSVYGWVVFHSTENDGETEYAFRVPVIKRAKPTDEVPPEQESVISQAIAALQAAMESLPTYNLTISGRSITLSGSDGSADTVTIPLATSSNAGLIHGREAAGSPHAHVVEISFDGTHFYQMPEIIDFYIERSFIPEVTTTEKGAMSAADKNKLDKMQCIKVFSKVSEPGKGYLQLDCEFADGVTQTAYLPLILNDESGTIRANYLPEVTSRTKGAMSAADKIKLDSLTSGVSDVQIDGASVVTDGVANINTFVGATNSADGAKGLVPAPKSVTNLRRTFLCANGKWEEAELSVSRISNGSLLILLNGTGVIVPVANTTQNGVMSASDKSKLDSITMSNGKIDASVLPSYVDDVIEAYPRSGETALSASWLSAASGGSALTPETGKIYVLMEDSGDYAANTQFRWGGTVYVKLSDGGVSSITNAEIDTILAS